MSYKIKIFDKVVYVYESNKEWIGLFGLVIILVNYGERKEKKKNELGIK